LACEVQESIKALKGNGPKDLMDVTFELGAKLLIQAKLVHHKDEAIQLQKSLIDSRKALAAFETMVDAQGGRLDELDSNAKPDHETVVHAPEDGIIEWMDTESIGWTLVNLGCGRKNPGESLDNTAGIEFLKKVGEEAQKGDPVYRIFNSDPERLNLVSSMLEGTFRTEESAQGLVPILGIL
jgi:thymidine phosphorylase